VRRSFVISLVGLLCAAALAGGCSWGVSSEKNRDSAEDGAGEASADAARDGDAAEQADLPGDGEPPGDGVEQEEAGVEEAAEPVEEDGAVEEGSEVVEEDAGGEDVVDEEEAGCPPKTVFHPGFGTCVSTERLNRDCKEGDACGADCYSGQQCTEYRGIGGHLFCRCLIPCGPSPGRLCPEGYSCLDIADGPQNVCMVP